MTKLVANKTQQEIVGEWDALSELRFKQITNGKDITYNRVLVPAIQRLVGGIDAKRVIDAGCGVGALTPFLSKFSSEIIGIDPSAKNIELAQHEFGAFAKFQVSTLEDYASSHRDTQVQLIVANMVMMDVLNLSTFLEAASDLLAANASLIFTIPHPWFWPYYRGYSNEPWFDYNSELAIETPFVISNESRTKLLSTHVHRPLSTYLNQLILNGLQLAQIEELYPEPKIHKLYRKKWEYPRYLVGRCQKIS